MEQSISSADWEEWLIQQRVMLSSKETLTGWKNRMTGTSSSSTGRAKSCTLGTPQLESNLEEKDLDNLVDAKLNRSQQCALGKKG